jgi:hypothetical protein
MKGFFVVASLPRSGSTNLAALLNCHPEVKCVIEPFHPLRHGGDFHRISLRSGSVEPALSLMRHRWNGIKHVWEVSNGWPFESKPELNEEIVLNAQSVVLIERRNYLRRYVSGVISKQLGFWVGTRQEFLARLETIQLRELEPELVKNEIARDRSGITSLKVTLTNRGVSTLHLVYEDLFGEHADPRSQAVLLQSIWRFLGFSGLADEECESRCKPLLDKEKYKWASPDVYRMIPRIERLEREVGCDETGWLFQGVG